MFTGIVEDMGRVRSVEILDRDRTLVIESRLVSELEVGGSLAVNGTCLTAVRIEDTKVRLEVVGETLDKTALGELSEGDFVNVELPMTAASMFDGHIVQGHVDGTGRITSVTPEGNSMRIAVEAPDEVMRYIVDKGSVTVDGVSLTIAGTSPTGFEVAVIPHTLEHTTLGKVQVENTVNIEVDVLAKYVERMLNK